MIIKEVYRDLDLTTSLSHVYISRDGQESFEEEEVLAEHLMEVYVNEILTMKLICLPEHLTELVLGRLLSEGIISSVDEVESIYVCEFGSRARVMLKDRKMQKHDENNNADYVETTPSCCTNNHILNDFFVAQKDLRPVEPISWKKEWIFHLADTFAEGMPVYDLTHSAHSAFLAMGDQILFKCEDIGRHNALDKAIGYALRKGIDIRKCILFTSGRIPTDMISKAVRAGVPILAGKATVTDAAVAVAETYHLTVIGAARKDRMIQYTGPKAEE